MTAPVRASLRIIAAVATTGLLTLTGAAIAPPASADPAEDFTACMRAEGLPGFPAGTVTEDGRLLLEAGPAHLDPFSPAYRAAAAACAGELPPGTGLPADPTPPQPPSPPAPPAPQLPAPPGVPGS